MQFQHGGPKRALRAARKPLLAAVIAGAAMSSAMLATAAPALAVNTPPPAGLTFYSNFSNGIQPWTTGGGGAQCSNYGTPSTAPRLRGTFAVSSSGPVAGESAGVFSLPANSSPTYSKEACELVPKGGPLGLGTDQYYGYMFDVPMGFSIGTNSFWGIATAQYHFQNIWGAPITFELHNDHMTLALETGSCNNSTTRTPGCQDRSNADNPGNPGNLGAQYVVPPGSMQQGAWHEVIMHVHWASDNTGQIQIWHRVQGASTWTQTVNLTGLPTVQYDAARGCCANNMVDKVGAYRASSPTAASVAEANVMTGSSFNNVAANLP